jgi:hypothetical protein
LITLRESILPFLPPQPLLALGFANAALLYGLAAASVPILLHLLNRRRHREVTWAAMRFLLAAMRKNRRRIRVEQWLLLAIRTLIILLVVSAMAKPFLESMGVVFQGQRVHRVIVIDASMSMAYNAIGTTRFEQAKTIATQLVKDSRGGDAISIILMGEPPRVVIGDPSTNLAAVKKEIDELALTHGSADLTATFKKVDDVLEVSPISQKEVVFLTDLQAASWRSPSQGGEGLARILARIEARRPHSVVIDLGKPGGENRALTDLRLDLPVVTVGASVAVRGVMKNFGANPANQVHARLTIDGRLGPDRTENLPPGEEVPIIFTSQQFTTPGDHIVELTLDDDPLAPDNHRWIVVPVRESISTLLVDGSYKSEAYQAETDYLAQALSPTEGTPGQPNPIKVEVISEAQMRLRDLNPYDVIVLCNVPQFSPPEVSALEDYLEQGGGVVIFSGDQVVPENYNRLLFDGTKGILPSAIGPSIGDAAKRQAGFGLNALGYRHPLVAAFQGESEPVTAGLTQVMTYQYNKLALPSDSKAEIALAFESGDPAIIESPHHRGIVIQCATSADAGWTSWPLHKSYLPVMQQIVLRAAAGRLKERNIRVGQPYDESFPAAALMAPVTVVTPKGQPSTMKLVAKKGVSDFHFEQTDLSGPYQVRVGPPLSKDSSFAANTDPAESELTKLDRSSLTQAVPGWNFSYLTNAQELSQDTASVAQRGELHRPILFGVLILLLVESILAWKFGHNEPL